MDSQKKSAPNASEVLEERERISRLILREASKASQIPLLHSEELPNIELYMEQMLSFLEEHFGRSIHDNGKPVFTKSMVNNYTKSGLLPRPVRKKYSQEHLIILIYITLLKQTLSFSQIDQAFALSPAENWLPDVYEELTALTEDYRSTFLQAQKNRLERIRRQLGDACDPRTEALLFITLTSVESAVTQILCGRILDALQPSKTSSETEAAPKQQAKAAKPSKKEKSKPAPPSDLPEKDGSTGMPSPSEEPSSTL